MANERPPTKGLLALIEKAIHRIEEGGLDLDDDQLVTDLKIAIAAEQARGEDRKPTQIGAAVVALHQMESLYDLAKSKVPVPDAYLRAMNRLRAALVVEATPPAPCEARHCEGCAETSTCGRNACGREPDTHDCEPCRGIAAEDEKPEAPE